MRGSQTNKIAPALAEDTQDEEPPVTPLTAEQARELRGRMNQVSPWAIVGSQVGAGLLAAWVAGAWFGDFAIGRSLAYGALAVAVPAGVFARPANPKSS